MRAATDKGRLKRAGARAALAGCALILAACSDNGQSSLDPQSRPARDITTLWWGMLITSSVFFLGAVALLGLSWLRRNRPGVPVLGQREGFNLGMVVLFGIGIPIVTLIALFVVANFVVLPQTDARQASNSRMTIHVTGKQWFWAVSYPGRGVVTANEIHIPVKTRVDAIVQTADVIHSFWVPELNRKIDTIPGRRNRVLLYADRPGRYRGQCAEYCGAQHTHMGLYVYADPPARFRAWLAAQARPRRAPTTPAQRHGERVFETNQCASCHTIRGTPAAGTVGPDLTHVAGRSTIAALTLRNTPANLASWIRDPQRAKPGNRMPGLDLTRGEIRALVSYLGSLR